jgi:hypothetical protein
LRRKEEIAAWPRTVAAAGVTGERHQQVQHYQRWQHAAGSDGVDVGTRGESVWASDGIGKRERGSYRRPGDKER